MFREMRRFKQALGQEECRAILHRGSSGVLALSGDDGYPYALPISYVFDGEKLCFHGATTGHKVDAIRRCEKASFCVIDQDKVVPEEYTTHYRSVIAFGRIRILEPGPEFMEAIENLAAKYAPNNTMEQHRAAINRELQGLCMFVMEIEHLTGKQCVEMMRAQQKG